MNKDGSMLNKVGAGKSIINRHERTYKRGSLMFIEEESSTEMFIIRRGCVKILKQEGESTIELAQLGPGSVLGELSLLDHQPRSATAQVIEDTTVTVIDEELFTHTLKSVPNWLENMIQIVVKRLRDTMKKTTADIIKKSIPGVIQIILLLHKAKNLNAGKEELLYIADVRELVHAIIGLGTLELEDIFLHLIMKELLLIKKNEKGIEFIFIKKHEALRLYMQYLRMHQQNILLIGEGLSENAQTLVRIILSAIDKNGVLLGKNLYRISEQQLQIELERNDQKRFIDNDALDELIDAKLILKQNDSTASLHGHHNRVIFVCNIDLLKNVRLLHEWISIFAEEIVF